MKLTELVRNCPICGNGTGELLHSQSFILPADSPLPAHYNIVCCVNCGFVFADTPANQDIYNEYYTRLSKYEDLSISSGGGADQFDNDRLAGSTQVIQKFIASHSSSLLDIGCANGGLLQDLRKQDYHNIFGIDPSPTCISHVRSKGITCFEGDLFSLSFKNMTRQFDCIVLTHVLEHIHDLQAAVDNISDRLKEDGILFIEVPDASNYSEHYIVPYYYIDCEHINHFDTHSLGNLFCSKGFIQLESRNINFMVNGTNRYPAVYSVFQKSGKGQPARSKYSATAKESFLHFLKQSADHNENEKIIQDLMTTQEPVFVWGAGQFALRLLANSGLGNCNIQGFIDGDANKQGRSIADYTIFDPEHIRGRSTSVVVCSALHTEDIVGRIRSLSERSNVYLMK